MSALESALESVDPGRLVERSVRMEGVLSVTGIGGTRKRFGKFGDIYLVGAGKAAMGMASSLCQVLGDRIVAGAITIPHGVNAKLRNAAARKIKVTRASHPVPDSMGIQGTREILRVLGMAKQTDVVFVLLSGGGSALMPMPAQGLSLSDKKRITRLLVHSGATIQEINIVRKHLSLIKGGQLPRFAGGARIISLILSDVIGDDFSSIASGPTFPDSSSFSDALTILRKYKIANPSDPAVKYLIQSKDSNNETPKPGDPLFRRVHNFLIGNNKLACMAAVQHFRSHGIRSEYLGSGFDGEARDHGIFLARIAADLKAKAGRFAVVMGGETTVTIKETHGKGGRNQEAALSCASVMESNATVACFGTDGIDGNSDAAGAIVSRTTADLARKKGIDFCKHLDRHDSYAALRRLNALIFTGATGTNVNDISIVYSHD